MSGLLFLSKNDFSISKGTRGDILCNNIVGFSLILFYSTQCQYCKDFTPIFRKLPGSIGGCQFGIINISNNKEIIIKSNSTIAPIKYVPYIILFINGKSFMRYDGPPILEEIKRFVFEVGQKIQQKPQFIANEASEEKNSAEPNIKQNPNSIPSYCTGQPLYGDNKVCYLEFDDAYQK